MTDWFSMWRSVPPGMPSTVRVYRSLDEVPDDFGPCALTIGNFDGVHAGHRELMRQVVDTARANGWRAAALTFDPHPVRVIAPDRAPPVMTTPEQRAWAMAECGIEEVLVLPFTASTALLTPEAFVRDVLVRKLNTRAVFVGEDFRFGHKHAGNTELLRALGGECSFSTEFVAPVQLRGARVSSSRIRDLVREGRVGLACRLLMRPFALEGPVVSGHGIGRTQTVPTLNLAPDFEVLPGKGVYVTRTTDIASAQAWDSVTNVGVRPTFGGDALTVETYLMGPLGTTPEHGRATVDAVKRIRVAFLARIRAEQKFDSAEALKTRILQDVRSAQRYFRRAIIEQR